MEDASHPPGQSGQPDLNLGRWHNCEEVSMGIAVGALGFDLVPRAGWSDDWAWGVPLIVLTVVVHVFGLAFVNLKGVQFFSRRVEHTHHRRHHALFALVISAVVLSATVLHAVEAMAWAACYQFLGARPDFKSAMLYSLGAMTTYGSGLLLENQWRLMGAIEALSGWLLFGMTTAFLFWTLQTCYQIAAKDNPSQPDAGRHR